MGTLLWCSFPSLHLSRQRYW